MQKKVIEVDEYERRVIITALNDKRNSLIEKGVDTDYVDDTLLVVMDAREKKPRRYSYER